MSKKNQINSLNDLLRAKNRLRKQAEESELVIKAGMGQVAESISSMQSVNKANAFHPNEFVNQQIENLVMVLVKFGYQKLTDTGNPKAKTAAAISTGVVFGMAYKTAQFLNQFISDTFFGKPEKETEDKKPTA